MAISEDGEDGIKRSFDDLCLELNMDSGAQEQAWESYQRISRNYTLEGDSLHWLACALYVACRNTVVQTVGRGQAEGNFVSLTRLVRSTKLSLLEFFRKIRKWSDMANLPQEFREKVEKLERNFAVSSVIFKKLEPIFLTIFCNPADDKPKLPRSRKQKRLPCSVSELFNFTWTMFVQIKGNFRAISDDLVNSYHLLLCCIDWVYGNALLSNRKDLLNSEFPGLPDGFDSKDYKPPTEVPCLINQLCDKHDGIHVDAKGIKEHWWKPHIRKQFEKKVLRGRLENLTGVLEIGNFEANSKAMTSKYEEHLLNYGDFDERVFLEPNANTDIGTPAKAGALNSVDLEDQINKASVRQSIAQASRLAPSTPLTGRKYLAEKNETFTTPVTTATQSVHRLQGLLSGRKVGPSDELMEMFNQCSVNPKDDIIERVKDIGEVFCKKYSMPSIEEDIPPVLDFSKKRLQLGESLYFKVLENIMLKERARLQSKDPKNFDLSSVMNQDIFHRALIGCCLEIVLYSYNSQRTFPWIIEVCDMDAFYFYKVIELVIRAEDGLSRDVVKHLSYIEESVLESRAWRTGSPLWDVIEGWKKELQGKIPSVEDVHFSSQIEHEGSSAGGTSSAFSSPVQHPAVRRITAGEQTSLLKRDILQSPTGPSAADFMSPMPGSAKRRLFDSSAASSRPSTPGSGSGSVPSSQTSSPAKPQNITTFQLAQTEDGKKMLIQVPVQLVQAGKLSGVKKEIVLGSRTPDKQSENTSPNTITIKPISPAGSQDTTTKPKCTGSFSLFLRKLYHLASVRLQDLCEKLDIDSELHRQIWTGFEYTLMHHIDLLRDRHIDQLLMCCIYVMGRVTRKERSFQDIMRCYRLQPQAQSHVYRSILMSKRQRQSSGDSDSSTGSKKDSSSIRSESTLPLPLPNSHPPTPTRMAGTLSVFQFEDRGEQRGDLIHFYNAIFVDRIKNFSLKFATTDELLESPILSPLPLARCQQQSPRRISSKHSVFVSQHGMRESALTPTTKLLYSFNRSPATDLRAINNMLRMNTKSQQASKRILDMPEPTESSAAKKICISSSPMFQKRLEMVVSERKATNGMDS